MALFLLVDFARRQANRHLRQANRHLSQSEQERWEYGHRSLLDSTVTPNTFVDYSKSSAKCSGRVVQLPLVLAEHQPVLEALDHLNGRLVSPPGDVCAADAADADGVRCLFVRHGRRSTAVRRAAPAVSISDTPNLSSGIDTDAVL